MATSGPCSRCTMHVGSPMDSRAASGDRRRCQLPEIVYAHSVALAVIAFVLVGAASVRPLPPRDHVDLAEDNHYYDGDGREVFRQQIFWSSYLKWNQRELRWDRHLHVRSWIMNRNGDVNPYFVRGVPHYLVAVPRVEHGWGVISAASSMVTHTQNDPEMDDRLKFAKQNRVPLFSSRTLRLGKHQIH